MEVSDEELKRLIPYCPCRVCNQTWMETILGFFIHQNCRMCHRCLQLGLGAGKNFIHPSFLETARLRYQEHHGSMINGQL